VMVHEQKFNAPKFLSRTGLRDEMREAGVQNIFSAIDGDMYWAIFHPDKSPQNEPRLPLRVISCRTSYADHDNSTLRSGQFWSETWDRLLYLRKLPNSDRQEWAVCHEYRPRPAKSRTWSGRQVLERSARRQGYRPGCAEAVMVATWGLSLARRISAVFFPANPHAAHKLTLAVASVAIFAISSIDAATVAAGLASLSLM
jgi:hypothetical protein